MQKRSNTKGITKLGKGPAKPSKKLEAFPNSKITAVEAFDDQGFEPAFLGFNRRRRPGRAQADDDQVDLFVPGKRIGPIDVQRRLRRLRSLPGVDPIAHLARRWRQLTAWISLRPRTA